MTTNAADLVLPAPARRRIPHHPALLEQLRDWLTEGDIAAGARVPERVLCERFGVSRTPLREALKVLAAEGLVELLPNRGARVAALTPAALEQTFAVIGALEALAGELACRHIDAAGIAEIRALHFEMLAHRARGDRANYFRVNQRIHEAIVAAAGNAVLRATYAGLAGRIRRARFRSNAVEPRWDEAVAEHEAMIDALVRRDGGALAAILRAHLEHKYEAIQALAAGGEER